MTGSPRWPAIPTKLSLDQFEQFVLPHVSRGRRGPPPTLTLHKIFNDVLQLLCMGCQWKMLPIGRDAKGLPENRLHRLLDLCVVTDTLIGDADGLYHPASFNDRLVSPALWLEDRFIQPPHVISASLYRKLAARFVAWREFTGLAQNPSTVF